MNRRLRWLLPALVALLAALPAGALHATLASDSQVTYTAADPRGPFRGRAPLSSLELSFDPTRPESLRLRAVLQPARFDSGNFIRDVNGRRTVFDTDAYPEIVFEAAGLRPPDVVLPEGARLQATLAGRLSMHGVTRRVMVPVTVVRREGRLHATGRFRVRLSDYGMSRPSFLFWTVNDEVTVEFDVRAKVAGVD